MKVYAFKHHRDLEKNEFDKLMGFVSEEKQNRVLRFRRYKDAQMCLLGEILLRKILCRDYGAENSFIKLVKGIKGKPELKGKYEKIKFNYSHSGDWIVLAIGEKPVGIDIEEIKKIDIEVAQRFFAEEEVKDLREKGEHWKEYFFDLWTLKESYIKWDGRGLNISLKEFYFNIDGDSVEFNSSKETSDVFFKKYEIDSHYKMALCSSTKDIPERVMFINYEDLIF